MFALFKDGERIGKARGSKGAVLEDAMEMGVCSIAKEDFIGQKGGNVTVAMNDGYEIRPIDRGNH